MIHSSGFPAPGEGRLVAHNEYRVAVHSDEVVKEEGRTLTASTAATLAQTLRIDARSTRLIRQAGEFLH